MAVENDATVIKGAVAAGPEGGGRGGAASPQLYPPRTPRGLDPLAPDFAYRLQGFALAWLAQPGARPMGYLQVVDLDQVRRHFGRRWPGLCERVLQIAETTLESRLGPGDLYLVVSESLVWVLALGEERRDIEVRGRLFASELTRRLCGALPGGIAVGFSTRLVDFRALAAVQEPVALLRLLAGLGPPPEQAGGGDGAAG